MSTQSTNLVNCFDVDDIIVVDRAGSQSVFRHLSGDELKNGWTIIISLSVTCGRKHDRRAAVKRLYIVVEGQTEQEFVNSLIAPYLQKSEIYSVTPVLIRTSRSGRGGMVNYQHLYNTIKMLLASSQTDFVVTTLIDFSDCLMICRIMQSVRLLRIKHNVLRLWKMLLMTLCVIRVSFLTYSCMSSRLFCFQATKV